VQLVRISPERVIQPLSDPVREIGEVAADEPFGSALRLEQAPDFRDELETGEAGTVLVLHDAF
jgi:hypothetical protein